MSGGRLASLIAVLLVVGVAGLWYHSRADTHAHILLLDPATGETLHEHAVPGGYAVVAILRGGRVAVASEGGCPDDRGGHITVLDASLEHVLSSRSVPPCLVARLDTAQLRERFETSSVPEPSFDGTSVSVRSGAGRIVETYEHAGGQGWLYVLTARDAAGRVAWKRTLHRVGVVDARNGRVVAPVFGEFTGGSD
jgi:hypothetical protein